MMINNAGDVFKLCISTKKHRQALKLVKIKEKAHTVDMRIIYHINDILNDSQKFLMQDYDKSYNACNYLPYVQ